MEKANLIPRVQDSIDKYKTYTKLQGHRKESVENGYYLEALMIDYAMIEDCFSSVLQNSGLAILCGKNLEVNPALINSLHSFIHPQKPENATILKNFDSISKKMNVIEKLSGNKVPEDSNLVEIQNVLKSAEGKEKIRSIIKRTKEWNLLRNQYVHALFNKRIEIAFEMLPDVEQQGYKLARALDEYRKKIKKIKDQQL